MFSNIRGFIIRIMLLYGELKSLYIPYFNKRRYEIIMFQMSRMRLSFLKNILASFLSLVSEKFRAAPWGSVKVSGDVVGKIINN